MSDLDLYTQVVIQVLNTYFDAPDHTIYKKQDLDAKSTDIPFLGVAQDAGRLPAAAQGCGKPGEARHPWSTQRGGVATAGWLLPEPGHDGDLPSPDN